jgi:hypothetical protein
MVPTNVRTNDINPQSVVLSWDVSDNLDYISSYLVYTDDTLTTQLTKDTTTVTIHNLHPLTTYRFQIATCNINQMVGDKSAPLIVNTPAYGPPNVDNFSVISATTSSLTLGWQQALYVNTMRVSYYHVYIIGDAPVSSGIVNILNDSSYNDFHIAHEYTFTGLNYGTSYQCFVQAVSVSGISDKIYGNAAELRAITKAVAPGQPRTVMATPTSSSSISITWESPEDTGGKPVVYYTASIGINDDTSGNESVRIPGNTYTWEFMGLSNDIVYTVSVHANNEDEAGEAVVLDCRTLIGSPLDFQVASVTSTSIDVSWIPPLASRDITYYTLGYREYSADVDTLIFIDASSTQYTIEELQVATSYILTINSYMSDNSGNLTDALHVMTKALSPSAPTNLQLVQISDSFLTITWDTPSSDGGKPIEGYYVQYGNEMVVNINSPFSTKYTITNLDSDTPYTVSVCAYNEDENSSFSNTVEVSTLAAGYMQPTNAAVTDVGINYFSVMWQAPNDGSSITGYYVSCDDTIHEQIISVDSNDDGGSYYWQLMGLVYGTHYNVWIRTIVDDAIANTDYELVSSPALLSVMTKGVAPSVVENVVVFDTTPYSISITWDPPQNNGGKPIEGYFVSVLDASESQVAMMYTPDSSACIIVDPEENGYGGVHYLCGVSAYHEDGSGHVMYIGTTTQPLKPGVPSNVHATTVLSTSIQVSWNHVGSGSGSGNGNGSGNGSGSGSSSDIGGITAYKLTCISSSKQQQRFDYTIPVTSYSGSNTFWITGLDFLTTYTITVSACNWLVQGDPSAAIQVTTKPLSITQPVNVKLVETAEGKVQLDWDPPYDSGAKQVTRYMVQYKEKTG